VRPVGFRVCLFVLSTLVFSSTVAAAAGETGFSFLRLAGTHSFTEIETTPSAWGLLEVRPRVRRGKLRVLSHQVYLSPLADGTHRARFVVRVEGEGEIAAKISALGFSTEQTDEVVLPAQDQVLTGRVRIRREAGAYRVTTVELPRQATVRIRSRLAETTAQWCEGIPGFEALGGDCGALREALARVTLNLPPAGETYEIRGEDLTVQEREAIDRYLADANSRR